jgi:ComF family protein
MGKTEALRIAVAACSRAADALVAVTLAPRCLACARILDAPLAGPVCSWCWDDARRASGNYDGALRHIIHAFKYEGRRSLARPLGSILKSGAAAQLRGAHCAVPVPLYPWRRLRRGFNQAADLAGELGLPVVHALWRTRPTVPQTGLTASARRRNVHGAFRLSPFLSRRRRAAFIDDRIVVLVDDVMTTGATLNACALILMDAGVREVRMLTVARAPLPGDVQRRT